MGSTHHSRAGNSVAVEVSVDLDRMNVSDRGEPYSRLLGEKQDAAAEETHVGGVARVGVLEGARDGHGGWSAGAGATGDADLGAREVELRDAAWVRVVDAELLDAQEVLAVGDARGDRDRVLLYVGAERKSQLRAKDMSKDQEDSRLRGHEAEPPEKVGP